MNKHLPHLDLLREIAAHCESAGISKTEFGRRAVGDLSLVSDMENGRECRSPTIARIRSVLDGRAPE